MAGWLIIGGMVLAYALYQIAAQRGWEQGWNEARDVWRPEAERNYQEAVEWRRIAVRLSEKQSPGAPK